MGLVVIGAVMAILVIWSVTVQRRMAVMNENINNAMGQLGVQISSRYDALNAVLPLVKEYAEYEYVALIERLESHHKAITATSTPKEVQQQEEMIAEILRCIFKIAEQYPVLKTNEKYVECMKAVESYEKMVCTSRLIYNDSVKRMNRELGMFPIAVVAGLFGFHQREYLET